MALSGWDSSKRIRLIIDQSVVDATLTDFPVLINLTGASGKTGYDCTAVFDELGANSLKIAVENGDTGNECYVEIERWDNANESAQIWVKVPSVAAGSATILYLYYDSSHADNTSYVGVIGSTPGQAVWDSSFWGVYHLSQDPTTTLYDSTGNGQDLAATGMASGNIIDGDVGKCLNKEAGDSAISAEQDLSGFLSGFTFELHHKWLTAADNEMWVCCGNAYTGTLMARLLSGYYRHGCSGAGQDTATSIQPTSVWRHLGWTYDGTTSTLHENGTADAATRSLSIETLTTDRVWFGRRNDGYTNADFHGREFRVSSGARSAAWLKATYYSNIDGLMTYGLPSSAVSSSLEQTYALSVEVDSDLEQIWGVKLGAYLEQPWWLAHYTQSALEQPWGIRLLGQLLQPYGNAPVIQSELWQWYGDTSDVQSWISQRWGDAHQAQSALEQMYDLPQALQSVLTQRYAITGTEVLSYIEQLYNLHGYDAVRAALVQPWMIAAAESLRAAVSATVTVGGTVVDPYHLTVEWSADMYALSGELHFADQGTWLGIAEGDAVEVACAGQTAALIVAGKRRPRMPGQAVYIVELESAATLLDQPHALPLLDRWDGELASTVAQELADYASITVDWQIIDDYVYDLYANNETPLAVLQKLAGEWGGVLRCELDGTLSVVYDYPYPPAPAPGDTWETVSPAATLTDQDNFFTAEESLDRRPGYNRYLVGNQDAATAGERLEEETVSASRKYLRGYVVPWADQALYSLATSKDGVAIQPVSVPAADYLIEDELVEFVNGGGRTSYPVHAITSYTWQDDQLGAITHSEDGTLTAEVEGNSLLLLTYETRFLMWQADYPQIADVQFILERTE